MDDIKTIDDYISDNGEENERRSRRDYYIELALFLILGILLGVALKTEAAKRITMGYNDYKMKIMSQDYNIEKIQKDVLAKQIEDAKKEGASQDNPDQQNSVDQNQNDNQQNQADNENQGDLGNNN